jgi:hypothetical protein
MQLTFRQWTPLTKVIVVLAVLFAVYFIIAVLSIVFAGHTHHSGISP